MFEVTKICLVGQDCDSDTECTTNNCETPPGLCMINGKQIESCDLQLKVKWHNFPTVGGSCTTQT